MTHGIEAVGDALPSPSGDRIEIVLRELGGFIWIQVTVLIIFIRVVFSSIACRAPPSPTNRLIAN
jgi:hypothetical protein